LIELEQDLRLQWWGREDCKYRGDF